MSMYGVPPVPPAPGSWLGSTAAGPITEDVACRKCGYNLRGLSPEGRCPECGTAVGFSLQGDLLRFCDPGWVDMLRRGAGQFIWGIVIVFFGVLGAILLATAMNAPGVAVAGLIAAVAGYILMTVGWWLLTQPDPSGLGEDKYGTARKIIRFSLIVGIAQSVLAVVLTLAPLDDAIMTLLSLIVLLCEIVAAVGIFAQLYYLERLALRIPDNNLSSRAHFLMFALGITCAISRGLQLVSSMAGGGRSRRSAGPTGMEGVACFVGIALLVFFVMYLFLVEKMGKRFKEQAPSRPDLMGGDGILSRRNAGIGGV
jgi:hypothetical protein